MDQVSSSMGEDMLSSLVYCMDGDSPGIPPGVSSSIASGVDAIDAGSIKFVNRLERYQLSIALVFSSRLT